MDWFVLAKLFSGLISLVHLVRLYGSEEALVICILLEIGILDVLIKHGPPINTNYISNRSTASIRSCSPGMV